MGEDHLITCLKRLCTRFDPAPLKGRYAVAKKAGLSEQYLYQIIDGKPMANGAARSIGKVAREKITHAFPDWLVPEAVGDTAGMSVREGTTPRAYSKKPAHARPLVQTVADLAEQIDDAGLRNLIDIAELLARNHPLVKTKQA